MSGLTVRRGRGRDLPAVLATLEPLEPRTTHITGWLLERGVDRRFSRLDVVEHADGALAGLLLLARQSPERWCAWPFLADAGAAAWLAPTVDASRAWWMEGPEVDTGPLHPLLRRGAHRRLFTLPHMAMNPARPFGAPTAASRLATGADHDALARLYREYELPLAGTRSGLRHVIRDRLERGFVVVAEAGGEVAGALWTQVRSRRYWMLNALTVAPGHRERRVAWNLINRALAMTEAAGLGAVAVIADTNPMVYPDPAVRLGSWGYVTLDGPRRFRGHARLRSVLERHDMLTPREAEHFEDAPDIDDPPTREP